VLDNLAGHLSSDLVRWLFDHGVMPLYTAIGGSWLNIAIVVDDVQPPWKARFLEVRGTVQAVSEGGDAINAQFAADMLRLTPTYITSFGVNDEGIMSGGQQQVNYHGRKVE
jgi:hypothetical protein